MVRRVPCKVPYTGSNPVLVSFFYNAHVVELADTPVFKTGVRQGMWVQIPPCAPTYLYGGYCQMQ